MISAKLWPIQAVKGCCKPNQSQIKSSAWIHKYVYEDVFLVFDFLVHQDSTIWWYFQHLSAEVSLNIS
jgi:hypothetical protein